jgi:gliding motility-associated-like protein
MITKVNYYIKSTILLMFTCSTFFIPTLSAQFNAGNCPVNIDFEYGDFSSWRTYTGGASALNSLTPVAPQSTRHEILTRANNIGVNDAYGNFPVICPNGSGYSVKLGNSNAGGQAERISYRFTIPSGSSKYSVVCYYAVVFQDPGHSALDQPKFIVKAYDALTNTPVGCSFYEFVAGPVLPGFLNSTFNSQVKYRNWTPLTIDLSGYAGQQIILEFTTADCTLGSHFGYAYLDVASNCISPVVGYGFCNGASASTLTAPFGYQTYNWWDANYLTSYGTSQTLTLTPPPPNGTIINLDINPFPGFGCRDTISVIMGGESPPPAPIVQSPINYCEGAPPVPIAVNSLPGYIPKWYFSPSGSVALSSPPTINTNAVGTISYWVSQISFGGCEGPRTEVVINVGPVPGADFTINDTLQCVFGNNYQFSNTTIPNYPGTIYDWDFGDNTSNFIGFNASHTYVNSNIYNVTLKATKDFCSTTKVIPVEIISSPKSNFSYNNACQGNVVNFTNTSNGGALGNSQFVWNFGNGNTSTAINPSFIFVNAGSFPVKLTTTTGNCSHDTTINVSISEIPKANFTFTARCINDSIQFYDASTINFGSITSWIWDFGNGQASTLKNPKMAFSNYGNNNVKLTVSTGFCSKDTIIPVNVYEPPIASFTMLDTACLNQNYRLNDNSYFASGASNANISSSWWRTNTGLIYTTKNITTQSNIAGNITLQQVVYSANGCISDTNLVTINVKQLPLPFLQLQSSLCEYKNISFEDVTPSSATRNWTINSVPVSTTKKVTVNNLGVGPQAIRLQVADSMGCISLNKDTIVSVNKTPSMRFEYKDSCVEKPVPLEAFDNDVNNITQWYWNIEGTTTQGGQLQSVLFSKFGPSNIYAYGVAANGCVSDTVYKTIKLNYNPTFAGNDTIAGANEQVQLQAKTNVTATYLWTPSIGLNNANVQNPIASNTTDKTYKVTVTSVYGCESSDDVTIRIYNGPEIYVPTVFTPNNDGINDIFKITAVGMKSFGLLKVFDRFGKLVFVTNDPLKGWNGTLNGKFANAGTYIYAVNALDVNNKKVLKKGTIIVIR